MSEITVRIVLGTRPTHTPDGVEIPANWPIHNAPRPLYGDMAWQGDFIGGIFYVAVNPDGEQVDHIMKRNGDNAAYHLEWRTEAEAAAACEARYRKDYGDVRFESMVDVNNPDHIKTMVESQYYYWMKELGRA